MARMVSLVRALSLAAVTAALLAAAAGPLHATATPEAAGPSPGAAGFRPTGLPIVDTPITVKAIVTRPANYGAFSEMSVIRDLMERSNVRLEFEEVSGTGGQETVKLLFASRSYPDVTFDAAVTDTMLQGAVEGGDVWPLDDLIAQYAPNWRRAIQERPVIKAVNSMHDGKLYSLPYYREILNDYGIRDIMTINVDWLAKVGKAVPKTTEEFYQVLRAFRAAIDAGTLPKNGVPWAGRFHQWANGGEWDIYGSFGVWIKGDGVAAEKYLSVNGGKVEFGAADPRLKNAAAYLNKLYAERLITEEFFTDANNAFRVKTDSIPPLTGAFTLYFILDREGGRVEHYFDPLPPLASPDGTRLFRSQPVRMEKNKFVIYKQMAHPEVMVRFIDFWADDDFSVRASYGGATIQDNPDGTRRIGGDASVWYKNGPHNMFPGYISSSAAARLIWTGEQGARETYIRDLYAPYVWPQERHYSHVVYTREEADQLATLSTDIANYVSQSIADWIVNGGADAKWDAYLARLDRLGLPKLMQIFQAAYDRSRGVGR